MSVVRATSLLWDLFCQVIDNHGDLGVCWRLAADLAARGQRVRLWVDDASALQWMAPGALDGKHPGVQVLRWTQPLPASVLAGLPPADVLVEAFGCEIAPEFIATRVQNTRAGARKPAWINLEYLSAEAYVERSHGLPSPIGSGPAAGWTKWFFYPGFTPATGGLLREPDLAQRQARFDRAAWLRQWGIERNDERLISLFCYEPSALGELLGELAQNAQPTRLLVTAGRATAAVAAAVEEKNRLQPLWNVRNTLSISYLALLDQTGFDHLLWACDLNFVRGEDSLVRALWAAKPFVWQLYPQHDNAHHAKLRAFLDWLQAPPSLRRFHEVWNGIETMGLPTLDGVNWAGCAHAAARRLQAQADLATQLLRFVRQHHRPHETAAG